MDGQNQNPMNPQMNPMGNMGNMNTGGNMMPGMPEEKGHFGAWAGIVIIIAVLVLGGLYFWGKELNNDQAPAESQTQPLISETAVDKATADLEVQGNSDALSDIEADLVNTDLENLDADLQSI